MAKSVFNFHSEVLGFHETVHILFPDPNIYGAWQDGPFDDEMEVLYLLHGLRGGAHTWTSYTSIERYLYESGRKMIIVMPEMGNDFYTDHKIGWKYFTYVAEELPRIMETFMRVTPKREKTYVAGLSMGGYGALKTALTFPEKFGFAASFSGTVDIASSLKETESLIGKDIPMTRSLRDQLEIYELSKFIFGGPDNIAGTENDLYYLLEKTASSELKPQLYISCGSGDGLFEANKKFFAQAQEKGYDVRFHEERNMGHAWSFWDKEIEKLIRTIL